MKYIADLHLHTVSSGHAYNTIYEYAEYAKELGLKLIAMTDHGPSMGGAPHLYHFANMHCLPSHIKGVRVLKGIEANIINEAGDLDLPEEFLKEMEIVLASFHIYLGYEGSDPKKNTEALIRVLKNPKVNILAHPDNPQFPVDLEAVVEACKKCGVLPEVNNSSFTGVIRKGSHDPCLKMLRYVKKIGWKVAFGSDAHCLQHLGEFSEAEKVTKEAGLGPDDIVNTSMKMIEKYVLSKNL
jgi:putative hydrolase